MLERILVPLDGSPLAEVCLPHAEILATTFASEVHLLTVTETPPRQREVDSAEWRMAVAEARGYLNRIANDFGRAGLTTHVHVLEGSAPARTLDFARGHRMDLVALSRSARGGVSDFPMSGTAFKVVRGAPCSVLLSGADDELGEAGGYGRILAPVDCSRRSEWGASIAAAIARASGAELLLATVVPTPELLGDAVEWSQQARLSRLLSELNRETAAAHLESLRLRLGTRELTVRARILEDSDVGRALCRLEEEEDVSLVVIAAHGHTGDPGWRYGSTAMRLLDHARRPLAVFQDLPEAGGREAGGELRSGRARGARLG